MPTDAELLSLYVDEKSEDAFAQLVQRYLPLAYSAALRQFDGDSHQAQEVAQNVFTLLARKARGLRDHPALVGWLYTTTHHSAAKMRRSEQRRKRWQEQAAIEGAPTRQVAWEEIRPVIDESLFQLREKERTAVLLRFFSNQTYAEIGSVFGITENAARMRVERALVSLRRVLGQRGIDSTAAALGTLLTSQAMSAVPEGLASAVAASAFSTGAGGVAIIFMSSTAIKVGAVAVVLAAGSAGLYQHHRLRTENAQLQSELLATKIQLAEERRQPHPGPVQPVNSTANRSAEIKASSSAISTTSDVLASPTPPDPEKGLTQLQDFRNVGRATPVAAVQTIIWAIVHGDETLPKMLFLNKPTLKSAEELMAALSVETKEKFETPEKLAALYLSKMVLEQIDTLQIQGVKQLDPQTVEVNLLSGERGPTTVSMQWTPKGWLWKVKASVFESAKLDLLGRK